MTRFFALSFCFALLLLGTANASDARAVRQCPILPSDPIGKTTDEMSARSSDIFLATALDFTTSEELPPQLGVYTMEVLRVIKSASQPPVRIGNFKIVGAAPYSSIPQSYIDATERHERDGERFSPNHFNKTEVNGECRPFFRGFIGYNYLVFLEDGEFSAFEVINDIRYDALLQRVEAAQQ